jgi:two-component system, response regulator YesN
MIRVLIAEDEPPILRRTKRLIEHIDTDFAVAATAGDGEEALEKMRAEHFDVLFTDIRMPVMDGMKLMKRVQTLYPDCSIVVLSGYRNFEYVSNAIRAQAVDYLLKPIAEETLEKLLFKLKERFIALKREHMQQSVAVRINHMFPDIPQDGLQAVSLSVCLFCAGAMPHNPDTDLYGSAPDVWQKVSLAGLTKTLCPGRVLFVQEYMGDSPAEQILVYQQAEPGGQEWTKRLYEQVLEASELPLSCACMTGTVPVPEIGKAHKRLRRLLIERVVIGKNLYEEIGAKALMEWEPAGGDFAEDSEAAARYADLLSGGNPKQCAAFRRVLFDRFGREGWTQRRVVRFFQRVTTLLESKSSEPASVLPYREWFFAAVATAASLEELEEIVQSLDISGAAASEGNATIARVREYLARHYAEHITGQTLAKRFGYVPSYISYLFRQSYGQSPADYLTRLRLNKAKELMLTKPEMLVREVAEQVGFKNPYHFSRVFKKNEGLWPTDFRS